MNRRRLLRGCGVGMALPLLDAMAPRTAKSSELPVAPKRAAFFYIPNGVVQSTWHPQEDGVGFGLSPTLKPLEDMREKFSLYSHLDRVKVAGTDGHAQASTCWLSSAAPDELSPAGYPLKRTIDQIMAAETGKHTPFRSLELSCNPYQDNKESIYFDHISWYGHGHVAKSIRDPQIAFDRLFHVKEHQQHASVLDLVLADAKSLQGQLGQLDRRKLDEYLDSVRTVEKQIQRVQVRQASIADLELTAPSTSWMTMRRDEYIQIMGDLMILSLQTDLTRVASLMVAPERWSTPQVVHGLFDKPILHHSMTHEQGKPQVQRDLAKLDHYHVRQYAKLVHKMDAIQEGERSLLDNSMFLLGSGLSSGKTHVYSDLPIVIAGSCGGAIRMNQHLRSPQGTPVANLWLSLVQSMGVNLKRLGDSTGSLKIGAHK